ncbi:DUF5689 domain-containing protein [Chryseobacterium oranimense]|uniref:DUF5689 domain-containing protein n=1 Tax=Chryseobacterium oranimense TaxID=421058 RepID=UPI0021AFB79C|nr:DUF5689 domain-containing protein [Chryseobacterium oranimense]UWX61220.1 DUF5689 domain-containing protein [Chryseobacterium oranimense]
MKLIKILCIGFLFMILGCERESPLSPSDSIPEYISLYDLQKKGTGTLSSNLISGIVISDRANKNTSPNTVILQEEVILKVPEGEKAVQNFGIKLVFDHEHPFNMGDKIEVDISKLSFTNDQGMMSVKDIPVTKALKLGKGSVRTQFVTIEEVTQNFSKYVYQLISLADGKFNGSGKFTEPLLYEETAGSLPLTILEGATFKNEDYTQNLEMLQGILVKNNDKPNLTIRSKDDVSTTDVVRVVVDNFDKLLPLYNPYDNTNIYSGGFYTNVTQSGQSGNYRFFSMKGGTGADGGFTSPRNYLYLGISDDTSSAYYSMGYFSFKPLKGDFEYLRTITVTFAGSNIGPNDKIIDSEKAVLQNGIYNYTNYYSYYNALQPDNYIQVSLDAYSAPFPIEVVSNKYADTGIWHTITLKLPTKREMILQNVNQDAINAFLSSNVFSVSNMSKPREGAMETSDTATEQGSGYVKNTTTTRFGYNPVIISKIEYGYSK